MPDVLTRLQSAGAPGRAVVLTIVLHTRSVIALAVLIALMLGTGGTYMVLKDRSETVRPDRSACLTPCFGPPKVALPPLRRSDGAAGAPTKAGLEQVLSKYLNRAELGELAATVVNQGTGEVTWQYRGGAAVIPASVSKLVTAVAVLAAREPSYRIPTEVVAGNVPGEVVLVGGGDVTLTAGEDGYYSGAARLDELARQLKQAHPQRITTVIVDSSLYTGPTTGKGWDSDVTSAGYGAPVTPLAIDGARTTPASDRRSSSPDLDAGRVLADQLTESGSPVQVQVGNDGSDLGELVDPFGGTNPLASVSSPPISELVEIMLSTSDNVIAESLARQVALARDEPASFSGASTAVRQTLRELKVDLGDARLADGSGLSRENRLSTTLLAQLLYLVAEPAWPRLRSALAGLPIAGFTGTLHDRFDHSGSETARSIVRAKTGSLSQVSSLAGTITTSDGAVLMFAVIANGFATTGGDTAEHLLDELAATLAACGCR